MYINFTCDINYDTGLDKVLDEILDHKFNRYLPDKYYNESTVNNKYGNDVHGLFIILTCRSTDRNFKQRIRYVKKTKKIYIDIMFNYEEFMSLDDWGRKCLVGQNMVSEIPRVIKKYKFKDFDLIRFETELKQFFQKIGWVE